jgi:hypothetical protein
MEKLSPSALSPSARNKLFAGMNFEGRLAITTIVSGQYQWYLPLWFYCIEKELPSATPIAYIRGYIEPIPYKIGANSKLSAGNKILNSTDRFGPYTTAALRFTYDDEELRQYDYVLITDCDILMQSETPSLINQHVRACYKNELGCYHNYISARTPAGPKVPGVHFVTKQWWDKTKDVRAIYQKRLLTTGAETWDFDELMLYKIIKESGLPEPPKDYCIWAHHGIHLGDYRRRINNKMPGPPPHGAQLAQMRRLMADKEFMALVEQCAPYLQNLKETFDMFRGY